MPGKTHVHLHAPKMKDQMEFSFLSKKPNYSSMRIYEPDCLITFVVYFCYALVHVAEITQSFLTQPNYLLSYLAFRNEPKIFIHLFVYKMLLS